MVIREVNRLNPSLVLIGGDFATGGETGFASQSVWRSLDAPAYAVLGNHDYRVGTDAPTGLERIFAVRASADVTAAGYDLSALKDGSADTAFADGLTATLEENGVHVLRNEYARVSAGDGEVVIVGVDDGWAGMADPPDVPETGAFTVYLIHEPSCRADWDADLILAGHTHGGQFLFPVIDQLNDHGVIELAGMFDTNGTPTYVSRGRLQRELCRGGPPVQLPARDRSDQPDRGAAPGYRRVHLSITVQGWHVPVRRSAAPPGGGCPQRARWL